MNETNLEGKVVKSTGSWYIVLCEDKVYNCKIRGKLRIKGFDSTNPVAVGDDVTFFLQNDGSGVIIDISDRKNCIVRQSTNLSKQMHILACNVDQSVLIVSLKNPVTPIEFIDRFLVSSEAYQIPAKIIFNKTDLYSEEDFKLMEELNNTYSKIGYDCYNISVEKRINIEPVIELFRDKISIIAGNSGVGKSSLINLISPSFDLKIADISDKYKTGKHTTTFAEMLKLDFGGFIIDTPGIRAFGLNFLEKEDIAHNFPEMFELLDKCKYYNCLHIDEPECAVKKAFETGEISFSRYKSYISIITEGEGKYRKDDYN